MATYDLKYPGAAIDAILDTAYHLQQAGYIFRGSASDYSGTPTEREWVIAPAGFSGLGLSSAVPQGSIGICLYNGTSWTGKIINVLTLDSAPTRNSQNGVTSGGVAATLDEIAGGIMATFASLLFDDETAAADLSTKLSYAVKFSVSDVYQTVTHLNILAATTSKAGLLSAADKVKIDSFLTNLRSLTFADTTASADQASQITETLKATIGGVQEVIDSITLLAATSSKAGLLSASDKAYIDALPATLTSLSNSISAALALMESLVGYYVCDTAAATAAKTVAATGYSLTNGGCIRIKMTNANTAANVTLNINSTGAKALYYDGTQASSTNTWEAGEVLEVYYDGTQYQCASGGGKAEANNIVDVDTSQYASTTFGIDASTGKWVSMSGGNKSKVIPLPIGVKGIILTPTSSLMMYSLLSGYQTPTSGAAADIATGTSARYTEYAVTKIDELSNARFLCVRDDSSSQNAMCPVIQFIYDSAWMIGSIEKMDRIVIARCGTTDGIYADHTDGVVKSSSYQKGYLYKVRKGDLLSIVDNAFPSKFRYAFFGQYPVVGMTALLYGLNNAGETIYTSPSDGYLLITSTNDYPPVTAYSIYSHADKVNILRQDDNMAMPFIYKLDIGTGYLNTLSSATITDGVISISSGGSAMSQYALVEDESMVQFVIKPTADTFNVRVGRYNTSNGTLVGLRKTASESYIDLYHKTTLVTSILLGFSLVNGAEYTISMRKITCDTNYLELDIISNNGQNYHSLIASPERDWNVEVADMTCVIGKMWGRIYCDSVSGTCQVLDVRMFSPYKKACKAIVVGHSFVEGNSIDGMKMEKFTKQLQAAIGVSECAVMGCGGDTMQGALGIIQHYAAVFYRPQYILVCTGTNDNSMTLTDFKTWQSSVASACSSIGAVPVFFTIPPDNGSYEGQWASINAYLREGAYRYVDMDKCFSNNGTPVAARYLYDNQHPNPATHRAIFERIVQDVPGLLDETTDGGGGENDDTTVPVAVYTAGYNNILFNVNPQNGKWMTAGTNQSSKIIPIPSGIVGIRMKPTSNVMMWSLLSSYVPAANNGTVYVATGLEVRYSSSEEVTVTNLSNATILCVRADIGQTNAECPIIEWLYDAENWKTPEEYLADSVSELYDYAVDVAQTMPFGSLTAGYVEDNGKWMKKTSDNTHLAAHYKIAVIPGNTYKVKTGTLDSVLYWSSTGNDSNVVDNTDADIIGTKMTVKAGMQSIFQAPSGANYLYVMAAYYTGNVTPVSVEQLASGSGTDLTNIAPYYIVEGAQAVDISGLTQNACTMGVGGTWQAKYIGKHVVLPVNAGEKYVIVGDGNGFFGFLTSSYSAPVTEFAAIPFVAGTQRTLQKDAQCVTIPQGTAYLCFVVVNGGGGTAAWSIYKVASYKRRLSNITKFRMAHWNIGGFVYTDWQVGDPTHQIPAEDAATYAQKYRELINSINADVFGIAEYDPSFSAASLVTKDVIFQCYREIHEGHKNGANCNTLMSNICEWVGYEEVSFTASEYNRYYTHATVRMNGDNVHIVEAHLDHTYNAMREAEIAQLINDLSGYEYVIIAGDFNTGDEETIETELAAFTNAGFKMLNDGYLGLVVTSLTEEYVDNICVKGFSMQNINVSPAEESGTLSDHLLIYCDLTMQD